MDGPNDQSDSDRWLNLLGAWSDATPEEARRLAAARSWVVTIGVTVDCTLRSPLHGEPALQKLWDYSLGFDGEDWGWGDDTEVIKWEQRKLGDAYEHDLIVETAYEFHDVRYTEIPTDGDSVRDIMFDAVRPQNFNPPSDPDIKIHEIRVWPIDPD